MINLNSKKNLIISIIIIIILLILSFLGGIKYQQKSQKIAQLMPNGQPSFGSQQFNGQYGFNSPTRKGNMNGNRINNNIGNNERSISGEIIDKSNDTITVKLPNGSTQIIIYSSNTKVEKISEGKLDDLKVGNNITISGKTGNNILSADSIQIK